MFQCFNSLNAIRFLEFLLSLFLGAFLFAMSLTKVLLRKWRKINKMSQSEETKADMLTELSQFNCSHSDLQRLSEMKLFFRTTKRDKLTLVSFVTFQII